MVGVGGFSISTSLPASIASRTIGVTYAGRRANGDQIDLGHGLVEFGGVLNTGTPLWRSCRVETVAASMKSSDLVDHRQMLILANLAHADDGNLTLGQTILPTHSGALVS